MNNYFHNPDDVDPKDLPKNNRFLTKEELLFNQKHNVGYDPEIMLWDNSKWIKGEHGFAGDSDAFTYCVPKDWTPKFIVKNKFELIPWLVESISLGGVKSLLHHYNRACVFSNENDAKAWKELSQEKFPEEEFSIINQYPYHLVVNKITN